MTEPKDHWRYDDPLPFPATPAQWQAFRNRRIPPRSSIRTRRQYDKLSPSERRVCDTQRIARFARHRPLEHADLDAAKTAARALLRTNRHKQASTCFSLAFDGPAYTGKSWATLAVAEETEEAEWQEDDAIWTPEGFKRQPVAVFPVKPNSTYADFTASFAAALDIPYFGRGVEDAIVTHLVNARVRLVAIEDLSLVKRTKESGIRIMEAIKGYQNAAPVTFIVNGADLWASGLFHEGITKSVQSRHHHNPKQTALRFNRREFRPLRSQQKLLTWLERVEQEITLLDTKPGWLSTPGPLVDYIFLRTDGYIGSMHTLLELALARVIGSDDERITIDVLRQIEIGEGAPDGGRHPAKRKTSAKSIAHPRARAGAPAGTGVLMTVAFAPTLQDESLHELRAKARQPLEDAARTPDPVGS